MSVSSVTNAFASYAQQTTGASTAGGSNSAGANALQEATETKAQTAKEAQKGDRVAIKKLQREQQQETESGASEPGKGAKVDNKA